MPCSVDTVRLAQRIIGTDTSIFWTHHSPSHAQEDAHEDGRYDSPDARTQMKMIALLEMCLKVYYTDK